MNERDKNLPGNPAPSRVREVRKHLRHYGIAPCTTQRDAWRQAWEWAWAVAKRPGAYRTRWPMPAEIGTQYLVLVLAQMRDNFALRLPAAARQNMPLSVSVALSSSAGGVPLALAE